MTRLTKTGATSLKTVFFQAPFDPAPILSLPKCFIVYGLDARDKLRKNPATQTYVIYRHMHGLDQLIRSWSFRGPFVDLAHRLRVCLPSHQPLASPIHSGKMRPSEYMLLRPLFLLSLSIAEPFSQLSPIL